MIALKDFLHRAITDHGHKPTEWAHDRTKYVNASSVWYCARKQKADMAATPKDTGGETPEAWGVFARGHFVEDWLAQTLDRAQVAEYGGAKVGLAFYRTGDNQVSLTNDELMVSATPDGFMFYMGETVYLEIKSVDPRINVKAAPKPAHRAQVQFGMAIHNERCLKDGTTDMMVHRAMIIYVDASNFSNITIHEVVLDEIEAGALMDRAAMIHAADIWLDLEAEGAMDGGRECRTCPHMEDCSASRVEAVKTSTSAELPATDQSTLNALVAEYGAEQAVAGTAKENADALKREIEAVMEANSCNFAEVAAGKVRRSTVSGRTTYDTKQAIEDGVDLEPYRKTSNGGVRTTITVGSDA